MTTQRWLCCQTFCIAHLWEVYVQGGAVNMVTNSFCRHLTPFSARKYLTRWFCRSLAVTGRPTYTSDRRQGMLPESLSTLTQLSSLTLGWLTSTALHPILGLPASVALDLMLQEVAGRDPASLFLRSTVLTSLTIDSLSPVRPCLLWTCCPRSLKPFQGDGGKPGGGGGRSTAGGRLQSAAQP